MSDDRKSAWTVARSFHCASLALGALLLATVASGENKIIAAAIAAERLPADRAEDSWRKPQAVLEFLEVAPGQNVLDYFGGAGYNSELLARIVGPNGGVLLYNNEPYAQAAHANLMNRLARRRLANLKLVKGSPNYLQLEAASLDRVLFVMVYHDLYWQPGGSPEPTADPTKALAILFTALKPGGLVVVVDHIAKPTARENATQVANRTHRIDPHIVREDFERAGFVFAGESDALRSTQDHPDKSVFDLSVRRRTDQFIYKFRKP